MNQLEMNTFKTAAMNNYGNLAIPFPKEQLSNDRDVLLLDASDNNNFKSEHIENIESVDIDNSAGTLDNSSNSTKEVEHKISLYKGSNVFIETKNRMGNNIFLTKEEEIELIRAYQNTELSEKERYKARDKIINAHINYGIKLAKKFVFKYHLNHFDFEDFAQEAFIALCKTLDNFDLSQNVRFSTYSIWWIRAALQDYQYKTSSIIKIPSTLEVKNIIRKFYAIKHKYLKENPDASNQEMMDFVSNDLKIPVDKIELILPFLNNHVSLSSPISSNEGEDSSLLEDTIADDAPLQDETVNDTLNISYFKDIIAKATTGLNPRELDIFTRRKLAESHEEITLDVLATKYGVSRERIRQIEVRATEHVSKKLKSMGIKKNLDF